MEAVATGIAGELRVGYQVSARLGAWRLELVAQPQEAYTCRAEVLDAHDYWTREPRQDLAVFLGRFEWCWTSVEPRRIGSSVVVDLSGRPSVSLRTTERGR